MLLKSIRKTSKRPIISVLLPVYNAEDHVAEAIESVINQTIGIEKIQLILIDDGSTDRSPEICRNYAYLFPDNVFYYRKENGGVSSAVNLGLSATEGKYIARLDSDDTWDRDAFAEIVSFFNKHYDEIDCLSVRIKISGDMKYEHPLDFKYTKNRIIDLKKEPYCIQTTGGNTVFKASAIKGLSFDEDIKYLEDVLFNTRFLRLRSKYGVVSNVCYNYRKAETEKSLSNRFYYNRDWYLKTPHEVFFPLMNESKELFGKLDKYTQSVIAYFLRWRTPPIGIRETLTDEEIREYTEMIHTLLQDIDDDVIASIQKAYMMQKNYLYRLKYQCDIFDLAELDEKGRYLLNGNVIFNACGAGLARIDKVERTDTNTIVSGTSNLFLAGNRCSLHAEDMQGNIIPVEVIANPSADVYGFTGEIIKRGASFKILFSGSINGTFRVYTTIKDQPKKYYCTVTFGPSVQGKYSKESGVTLIIQ